MVAVGARGSDVRRDVSASIAFWPEMLGGGLMAGGLPSRQAPSRCKVRRIGQPHRLIAIKAAAFLGVETGRSVLVRSFHGSSLMLIKVRRGFRRLGVELLLAHRRPSARPFVP